CPGLKQSISRRAVAFRTPNRRSGLKNTQAGGDMKMTWRAVAGAVALAGLSLALVGRPAQAQAYSWSITPWAGAYIPTSNTTSNLGTQISRVNSFISGLRITGWGKSALGLELEGGYAPARATVAGTTINSSRDTKVFVGDVKLMIGVGTSASAGGVYLEVGPALIRRGSDLTT